MWTFLDLFCGAGGLGLGFEQVGFRCLGAFDKDDAAIKTYHANFTAQASLMDLAQVEVNALPQADVVVGGPPCQGFSSAGLRKAQDARNDLVSHFARIVCETRPRAFVFENVEGFLTAEAGHYVFALLRPLIACGYHIHLRKINAANFGVPQHRKRVLVIGGLGWDPNFPTATHSAFGAPGAGRLTRSLPPTPTLIHALAELPLASPVAPGQPQGHFGRPLQGIELLRAGALRPGDTMRDLPCELQHDSFARRSLRRVKDGTPSEKRGGAPSGLRRLRPNEPSKAITGGARSDLLHPVEHRTLTLRECARLQTFPDHFVFCGTASQQALLIGNAVPPLLAHHIGRTLAGDLALHPSHNYAAVEGDGQLLSFIPTLAEGVSPVLGRVIDAVKEEFNCLGNNRFGTSQSAQKELSLWP